MEQRMEAVLAAQPVWCLRGVLSDARGMQQDGAFNTVLR
jgi:transposase